MHNRTAVNRIGGTRRRPTLLGRSGRELALCVIRRTRASTYPNRKRRANNTYGARTRFRDVGVRSIRRGADQIFKRVRFGRPPPVRPGGGQNDFNRVKHNPVICPRGGRPPETLLSNHPRARGVCIDHPPSPLRTDAAWSSAAFF